LDSPEPSRVAAVAGVLVVVAVLALGVSLIEFLVAPPYRPAAMRLLGAGVLLVALLRVRTLVATAIEPTPRWGGGEDAFRPRVSDARFERFHEEVKFSARSQSYFDHMLWPKLVQLARAHAASTRPLDKPPGRRFGRGPSMAALARLIAAVERRP
jgi:hypothetical protein